MLTFLHLLVDFCSVAVLAMGGITFERWLAYNALAFALQLPLGVALDARPRWLKGMFAAGTALTVAGVALGVGFAGGDGGRGATALLVAFGLGHAGRVTLPWVALAAGGAWWLWRGSDLPSRLSSSVSCPHPSPVLVFALFALVVWRSWAGLLAGGMSSGAGLAFVLAGAAVTWAGKAAGGYAADALKRRGLVTAVSVAGSAALCFACTPSNAALWLALLFVAQLATGPVLSLMYDATERRAGTAFGLNCLGLFTGSLF